MSRGFQDQFAGGPAGLLDRLDLDLAQEAVSTLQGLDADSVVRRLPTWRALDARRRDSWIAGVLGVRGIHITNELVRAILDDRDVDSCTRQERVMVRGLGRALDRMMSRGRAGIPPDGWFVVALFRTVTQGLPRFTNNQMRRDLPWDALRGVSYPNHRDVGGMLDRFTPSNRFSDASKNWTRMHPVRQASRVLWRFARISPFPDFNRMFAFVLFDAYLLAHGYPLLTPEKADKQLLENLASRDTPPARIVQLESRLWRAVRRRGA